MSVYDNPVLDGEGNPFTPGISTDNDGNTRACVTFILLLPPKTILHAAVLTVPTSDIDSDVQDWNKHPAPQDEHPLVVSFPVGGTGPYLCTQGEGGSLTHFFSGNLHAVDFRCEVGTPLLAVGSGTVVEISQENTLTGVAVSNLFKWNSVMIQLDTDDDAASASVSSPPEDDGGGGGGGDVLDGNDGGGAAGTSGVSTGGEGGGGASGGGGGGVGGGGGGGGGGGDGSSSVWGGDLYVEYVHIKAGSCCVRVGDRVTAGQKICESGSVGFSPEPHLHFTAFRSREPTAPTTRVRFRGGGGGGPVAAGEAGEEGRGGGGGGGGGGGEGGGSVAAYVPLAGRYYNVDGEQPAPAPPPQ